LAGTLSQTVTPVAARLPLFWRVRTKVIGSPGKVTKAGKACLTSCRSAKGVPVAVAVALSVGVRLGLAVDDAVAVQVGLAVDEGVAVPVGLAVGEEVAVRVGLAVGEGVALRLGVAVALRVGVAVESGTGRRCKYPG
jgi:hypothetical protein